MTKHKHIFKALFILALLTGCKVQLVPDYSATLYEQIVNGAKETDKLYLSMLSSDGDPIPYRKYSERYVEITAEINSIRLKNQQRENNNDMLVIIDLLKSSFSQYENEHKTNGLSPGEAKANQAYMQGFWLPLLKAEGGLKKAKQAEK